MMNEHKTDKKAIIITGPPVHKSVGLSTHIEELLNSDLSNRFKMHHFETAGPMEAGDPSRAMRLLQFLWSPLPLIKMIIRSRAPVVHINTFMNYRYYVKANLHMLVAKLMGKKVIYQLHGGTSPQEFCAQKPFRRAFLKLTLRVADAIVVLNKDVDDAFREFAPGRLIFLIPNAIDLKPFSGFPQKNFEKNNINLLYIGRLSGDKGIIESIEALSKLKTSDVFNNLHLFIAGKGSPNFKSALVEKAETLGMVDKVTFLGPVFGDKKMDLLKGSDIFLLPTYHREGLPYAILESLAAGLPIITTDVEGIRDTITHGIHGIFVESHSAEAISSALETLCLQKDKLRQMSANCRRRAVAHYGIHRLEKQFSDLYNEISGGILK